MIIEHDNWAPAIDMFNEMQHFNKKISDTIEWAKGIHDFSRNLEGEPHLELDEIKARINKLIYLKEMVDTAKGVLESVRDAYHRYQEMYFEELENK